MREFLNNLIAGFFGSIVLIFLLLVFFTPEKDKNGEYTKFFQYWSSDEYFCSHYNIDGNYCKNNK